MFIRFIFSISIGYFSCFMASRHDKTCFMQYEDEKGFIPPAKRSFREYSVFSLSVFPSFRPRFALKLKVALV